MAARTVAILAVLAAAPSSAATTAILGATVVNVDGAGRATHDVRDAVVLVEGGQIVKVGNRAQVRVPRGARRVPAAGRYLIPGLIDAYGAVRTKGFAEAYLYEGVTTVMVPLAPVGATVDGETRLLSPRDGLSVLTAVPISGYDARGDVPRPQAWANHRGDHKLSNGALLAEVRAAAAAGHRRIDLGLDIWPSQMAIVVAEAHRLGLGVTAEVAYTTHPEAILAGVDAFVRNDKYSVALAPASEFQAYADDPMGPGGRAAARTVCAGQGLDTALDAFAGRLRAKGAALMPVLSMEATADDVGGPNPWSMRSAAFVTADQLDDPVDPVTGARPFLESHRDRRQALQDCARQKQAVDRQLAARGVVYLAGSSAPGFGVMPGGGLHGELRLLQGLGLTPRQALAAATSNIAASFRLVDRGQLLPGRRADLVLLAEDPRQDTAALDSIVAVMAAGHWVDRQALLRKAPEHAAAAASASASTSIAGQGQTR